MLEARGICKAFDGQPVLQGVSLEAHEGEIVALLGPSGCGKTTLLRVIAGLETADQGELLLDGATLASIPVHERRFGMVFQDYALFPHKNVWQNVAFGLRMLDWKQDQIDARVQQVLELVGLREFGWRAVHDLSGGEQQRIALARALAPFPRLLLMDEPLGSLDRALRERLMSELRSILKKAANIKMRGQEQGLGLLSADKSTPNEIDSASRAMTSVYVTHDQEEAFAIADRIMVMNQGRIEQTGTPVELYRQPSTVFVARFLGMENLFEAEILSTDPPVVRWALGQLSIAQAAEQKPGPITLMIGPEAASLASQSEENTNILKGELVDVSFRGRHQIAVIEAPGKEGSVSFKFNFDSSVVLPATTSLIWLRLNPKRMRLLTA